MPQPKIKTKQRLYQPIWEHIKEKGYCNITSPKETHRRIIKAVIKEKNNDLAFKVLSAEKWKWNKLQYEIQGSLIKFTLTHSVGEYDL